MNIETMNIETMNLTELKSLAYDISVQININQQNLKKVQQKIQQKIKEEQDF